MAFKNLQEFRSNTTISLGGFNDKSGTANPSQIEGFYLGSRTGTNSSGEFTVHTFQTPKGNIDVWGKSKLTRLLSQVDPGVMVKATYLGKVKTPKGNMHDFQVAVDEDQTIDVASLVAGEQNDNDYTGVSDEDDSDQADEDNTTYHNQISASTAAIERKNKTAELLAKGKAAKGTNKN